MLLNFETEAKSLRPRPKGPKSKAEAEARGYETETETEAEILASRPVWPWRFNISVDNFQPVQKMENIDTHLLFFSKALTTHGRFSSVERHVQ